MVASLSGVLPMLLMIPLVVEDNWNNHFYQLEEKLNLDGTCDIDADYVDSDGYSIGSWSIARYREYIGGELNENRKKALEQSGFIMLCSENPSFI
ncbi:hypothetical protein VCHA53O466_40234 [Vibrio chagasii]|nr:hypothetical protein VCHA53O466_40234 [Vibrio chagasii]